MARLEGIHFCKVQALGLAFVPASRTLTGNCGDGLEAETAMNGKKAFVALTVTTALGVLGAASAMAMRDDSERHEDAGAVTRCSLDGVNPVYHPKIFGNPSVAKSYGFERSRDGAWHVVPGCRQR
jgi:hypothetical protein